MTGKQVSQTLHTGPLTGKKKSGIPFVTFECFPNQGKINEEKTTGRRPYTESGWNRWNIDGTI